jgi:hypothetical protein
VKLHAADDWMSPQGRWTVLQAVAIDGCAHAAARFVDGKFSHLFYEREPLHEWFMGACQNWLKENKLRSPANR